MEKNEKMAVTDEAKESLIAGLKKKYGKIYHVSVVIPVDDMEEETICYTFQKPTALSFDRYLKSASQNASKSMKQFLLDNITEEEKEKLIEDMEEYPAISISLGDKLMGMLGLSKETSIKKL